jgi:hypothetical protein
MVTEGFPLTKMLLWQQSIFMQFLQAVFLHGQLLPDLHFAVVRLNIEGLLLASLWRRIGGGNPL